MFCMHAVIPWPGAQFPRLWPPGKPAQFPERIEQTAGLQTWDNGQEPRGSNPYNPVKVKKENKVAHLAEVRKSS